MPIVCLEQPDASLGDFENAYKTQAIPRLHPKYNGTNEAMTALICYENATRNTGSETFI